MRGSSVIAFALLASASACAPGSVPRMPWERERIIDAAPMAPILPLTAPTMLMKGTKGPAPAPYPAQFSATMKPDGWIVFPDGSSGKVQGASIFVAGAPVLTVSKSGDVSGNGLKTKYKFTADGDLLDDQGRGVRIQPTGGVRAIGGKWHYQDVFTWSADGGEWNKSGWRELAVVSLLVIENLMPEAIR
jgi:hypothetical protein